VRFPPGRVPARETQLERRQANPRFAAVAAGRRVGGAAFAAGPAADHAPAVKAGDVVVEQAWARATPKSAANGAAAGVALIGAGLTFAADSRTGQTHPAATRPGRERIERNGDKVTVFATAIRSHFTPEIVEVEEGDEVTFHITNTERAQDEVHGFAVSTFDVNLSLEPGKTATAKIKGDKPGVYPSRSARPRP
jgi:heme/copper-type cytochrome/quinol oxidase subunit 2